MLQSVLILVNLWQSEIRKRLAKSQLHQDFEKVEINVVSHPNELDDGDDVDTEYESHISIFINVIKPKSSLKDLSSFENFDSYESY